MQLDLKFDKSVSFIRDTLVYLTDFHSKVRAIVRVYAGETYEIAGSYNYYRYNTKHWNQTMPVIELPCIGDEGGFTMKVEVEPDTFVYLPDLKERILIDLEDRYYPVSGDRRDLAKLVASVLLEEQLQLNLNEETTRLQRKLQAIRNNK